MLLALTANVFLIPWVILLLASLAIVAGYSLVQRETARQAAQARLKALAPPAPGKNHRSLPSRQYFLTQKMAKPTPADELLLLQWHRLQTPPQPPLVPEK